MDDEPGEMPRNKYFAVKLNVVSYYHFKIKSSFFHCRP